MNTLRNTHNSTYTYFIENALYNKRESYLTNADNHTPYIMILLTTFHKLDFSCARHIQSNILLGPV